MDSSPARATLLVLIVVVLSALGLIYGGVTGIVHLQNLANPSYSGSGEEYPVVHWLFDFFTTDKNNVNVARVAQRVQSTFMLMVGLGLVLLIACAFSTFALKNKKRNS